MQSVSKRNIDVATARQMVTAAFGAHAAIGRYAELRDGYFNAAYQIDLADGRRVVLKVAPSPGVRVMRYEHGILGSEVQMLRLVREHTNVPVPEVYFHDDSLTIIDSPYFLMSFVAGQAYHQVRDSYHAAAACHRRTDDRHLSAPDQRHFRPLFWLSGAGQPRLQELAAGLSCHV